MRWKVCQKTFSFGGGGFLLLDVGGDGAASEFDGPIYRVQMLDAGSIVVQNGTRFAEVRVIMTLSLVERQKV